MTEVATIAIEVFHKSVKAKSVPFDKLPGLKLKILKLQDDKTLSELVKECCSEMLIELVSAHSSYLTFHWLDFLYKSFGDVISRLNMREVMNSLLLVHRTLFAGDDYLKKLAFVLWEDVIQIVFKLPGSSKFSEFVLMNSKGNDRLWLVSCWLNISTS